MAGPYGTSRTWAAGEKPTAAQFNAELRDWIAALANPPRAGASRTTTQSITNGAWNLVTFTIEDHDTDGMFTTGAGDRFTCVTPGRYVVCFTAPFTSNTTGLRAWAVCKGVTIGLGAFAESIQSVAAAGGHAGSVTGEVVLAAADTVSCQVFQSSGGALNLTPGVAGQMEPMRATIRRVAAS